MAATTPSHVSATRTAVLGGRGNHWVVDRVPVPDAGDHDLLVEVHAAGMNRVDLDMLAGNYNGNNAGRTYVAGREAAGVVVAAGPLVEGFAVGDRVMGATPQGGFASVAPMDARHALPVPPGLDWTGAAALPVGLSTEHDALLQSGFRPGNCLLVLGGGSSIGLIGVSMAKALGASLVVATTTSDQKSAAIVEAGADVVVNTREDRWADQVLEATDGRGVDVLLDHLGGTPLADSLRAVHIGGRIVNIGRLAGRRSDLGLDDLSFRRLHLIGTTFSVRTAEERGAVYFRVREQVLPAVEDGKIRARIDRVFGLDQIREAQRYLASGTGIGKVVLSLGGDHGTPAD